MSRTNIQIPVSFTLKQKIVQKSEELGFSSPQELIRVFLAGVALDKYDINISSKKKAKNVEYITEEQYKILEKKLKELKEAQKKGEAYTVSSVDEMMAVLNSDEID